MMKTGKSNFLLPLICLLMLSAYCQATDAGRMMWVLGSFRHETSAESQAQVLSRLTGQEILIQSLLVNDAIRHRLMIQPEADAIDQERLLALLRSGNFNDHWRVWVMGDEMGLQSVISVSGRWQDEQDATLDTLADPVLQDFQEETEIREYSEPYKLSDRRSEQVVPLSAPDAASKIRYNPASMIRQDD